MMHRFKRHALITGSLLLALWAFAPQIVAQDGEDRLDHPGYVDPASLIRVAGGDDAIRVEVQIHGAALRLAGKMDNPIGKLARGLVAVRAVILEIPGENVRERTIQKLNAYEKNLRSDGWERLATVRDGSERVHVLIRERGDEIIGLTVLIVDGDTGELVFTNIAGTIDLDAISDFGDQVDIPGLDVLKEVK